jgi:hypothetical protein
VITVVHCADVCNCGEGDCVCDQVCSGMLSLVLAEMDRITPDSSDSDTSNANSDSGSDTDSSVEFQRRKPVLISDTDSD